jgi:hypothetical protein
MMSSPPDHAQKPVFGFTGYDVDGSLLPRRLESLLAGTCTGYMDPTILVGNRVSKVSGE